MITFTPTGPAEIFDEAAYLYPGPVSQRIDWIHSSYTMAKVTNQERNLLSRDFAGNDVDVNNVLDLIFITENDRERENLNSI